MKITPLPTPGPDQLRASFWLHDLSLRGLARFDLKSASPAGYAELTEEERLTVAEFAEFLVARRANPDAQSRRKFFLRDRSNRPIGDSSLAYPAEAPVRYAELSPEERCHVIEFIQFLLRRRVLRSGRASS